MISTLGRAQCLRDLGLTKVAYGPKEMQAVFKEFKRKQLPKAAIKGLADPYFAPLEQLTPALGFAGLVGPTKKSKRLAKEMYADFVQYATPDEVADLIVYRNNLEKGFTDRLPRSGATYQNSPASRVIDRVNIGGTGVLRPKTPDEHKALEAVFKGHELAETQVSPSKAFKGLGHNSPDVILREHNMVTTLPPELANVGTTLKDLRDVSGEAGVLKEFTGVDYGEGQRFSRHARKHLTRMIEDGVGVAHSV